MKTSFSIGLGVLTLLAASALSARADSVPVSFIAMDLKSDSMLLYLMNGSTKVDSNIFRLPAPNNKECWDTGQTMRKAEKQVELESVGEVEFDKPLKFNCSAGLTLNLAGTLRKKTPEAADAAAKKLFRFVSSLASFTARASTCLEGGVLTTSKDDFADSESDPLNNSITELANGAASFFEGGIKTGKNSVKIQGGEILNALGVKEVSCAGVAEDGTLKCKVAIPGTKAAVCLKAAGGADSKVDTDSISGNSKSPVPSKDDGAKPKSKPKSSKKTAK